VAPIARPVKFLKSFRIRKRFQPIFIAWTGKLLLQITRFLQFRSVVAKKQAVPDDI